MTRDTDLQHHTDPFIIDQALAQDQSMDLDTRASMLDSRHLYGGLAAASAALILVGAGAGKAEASNSYNCDGGPLAPGYNTIICGVPKQQVANYCANIALQGDPVLHLRASYVKGHGDKYRYQFTAGRNPLGCDPAGSTKISSWVQLNTAESGSKRLSRVVSKGGDRTVKVKKTTEAKVDCTDPINANGTVTTAVKVTWRSAKGFPKAKKNSRTIYSKATTVCKTSVVPTTATAPLPAAG